MASLVAVTRADQRREGRVREVRRWVAPELRALVRRVVLVRRFAAVRRLDARFAAVRSLAEVRRLDARFAAERRFAEVRRFVARFTVLVRRFEALRALALRFVGRVVRDFLRVFDVVAMVHLTRAVRRCSCCLNASCRSFDRALFAFAPSFAALQIASSSFSSRSFAWPPSFPSLSFRLPSGALLRSSPASTAPCSTPSTSARA